MATINGTSGDDNLVDTNDTDTLNGLDGNDTITVTANQDTANGGTGSDRLIVSYAAATSPVVLSIGGADAEGHFGSVTESAARGVNFTGFELFTITAGSGDDNITTGSGDDVVTTGDGADTVNTGSGNDTINTGSGNDIVSAGAGDDLVIVGFGYDIADGGDGIDGISATVAFGVNWNLQTNSFSGTDDSFTNFEYFANVHVSSSPNVVVTGLAALNDVITTAGFQQNNAGSTISVFNGHDRVSFQGFGPDKIIVDYSAATSAVTQTVGFVSTTGGSGFNTVITDGGSRSVTVFGLKTVDITTGSGNDDIRGVGGNDTFRTNGGNDIVFGADGNDTFVLSGNRANYLVTQNGDGSLTIVDTRAGSPDGTDNVRAVENFAFADGTLTAAALTANPPAIDLNGAAFGIDNSANYAEGDPPAILAPGAVVTDADSPTLGGGTVRISSGFQAGLDMLSIGGATSGTLSGITFNYNGATGVLTLSGTASIADYQALLRQVAFSTTSSSPTERPIISWTLHDGTVTGGTSNTELVVEANDGTAVAQDDAFATNEATVVAGNLFADNGYGADSDPDGGAFAVTAVNGIPASVGSQITLASGALLTVNADGTFSYDPNGRFNATPAPGSGASNLQAADTFTYAITGGETAMVTINIAGVDNNDDLAGTAGNDLLDGGIGSDTMSGFGGNDWYIVRDAGDRVFETAGNGTDRVFAYVDWTLNAGAQIETLSTYNHTTTEGIDLTGNELAQTIIANYGNNILEGGGGADVLHGLLGDDWYVVRNASVQISEINGEGHDRVFAYVDYTLGEAVYVESLETNNATLTTAINLTGSSLNQTLYGNAGANRLDGKSGQDTLYGDAGADTYLFTTAFGGDNIDRIYFEAGIDKIAIAGIDPAQLQAGAFALGSSAQDAGDRVIYDQATGNLYYDSDGSGAAAQILFAVLDGGPVLTANDFVTI